MRFFPSDSTETNMAAIKGYIKRHGRPLAIYADKASHFLTTKKPSVEEQLNGTPALTQIQRALKELDIEYIAAHSPQAKGRVERCFGTAQDRLVKEFRLNGISTIDQANEFLKKQFIPMWNLRFTVKPAKQADLHRSRKGFDLDAILSRQHIRTVANDYTVSIQNQLFLIHRKEVTAGLRGSKVLMEQRLDGSLRMRWKERYLVFKPRGTAPKDPQERPWGCVRATPSHIPSQTQARTSPPLEAGQCPDISIWHKKGTFLLCVDIVKRTNSGGILARGSIRSPSITIFLLAFS